jgi:hypothetical protein
MYRNLLMAISAALALLGTASAQEATAGAGRVEIGAFPGGGMFFTESSNGDAPDFGNYAVGASLTFNMNRWLGVEAEGGGSVGVRQNFSVRTRPFVNQRTPSIWAYSGNLVVNPNGGDRPVVPYLTGGIGGLTMCPCNEAENLGITTYETYLTANAGGGLKWFATQHFGIRGDYRFFAIKNKDAAPLFFGTDTRYGHRVQAGLVFTY